MTKWLRNLPSGLVAIPYMFSPISPYVSSYFTYDFPSLFGYFSCFSLFPILGLTISLPVFTSRTNQKLHNISITPKMVKKVITHLDSSKASGPDYIPVVVVKNCEPELSDILAELFNMFLRESCFPDCWKVLSVVPAFENVVFKYLCI